MTVALITSHMLSVILWLGPCDSIPLMRTISLLVEESSPGPSSVSLATFPITSFLAFAALYETWFVPGSRLLKFSLGGDMCSLWLIIDCQSGRESWMTRPFIINFAGYAIVKLALGVFTFSALNRANNDFRASAYKFCL